MPSSTYKDSAVRSEATLSPVTSKCEVEMRMGRRNVVPAAGVEPATFRSGGERSNPLSYAGMSPFRMNH